MKQESLEKSETLSIAWNGRPLVGQARVNEVIFGVMESDSLNCCMEIVDTMVYHGDHGYMESLHSI